MPLLVLLHDALVGLRVGVDLILQRVQLQLADAMELVGRKRHVRREREQAYHEERRGVVRGRNGGASTSANWGTVITNMIQRASVWARCCSHAPRLMKNVGMVHARSSARPQ